MVFFHDPYCYTSFCDELDFLPFLDGFELGVGVARLFWGL